MIKRLFPALWLVVLVVGQAYALPAVPTAVPGMGQPLSDADAKTRYPEFCRPIRAWNLAAYEMCVDAGEQVNQAIREYHGRGCATHDATGCDYFAKLYWGNFRLWDGSVDNVSRARGMQGAAPPPAAARRASSTPVIGQCERLNEAAQNVIGELSGMLNHDELPPGRTITELEQQITTAHLQQQAMMSLHFPRYPKHCSSLLKPLEQQFDTHLRELEEQVTVMLTVSQQQLSDARALAACHVDAIRQWAHFETLREDVREWQLVGWRTLLRDQQAPWADVELELVDEPVVLCRSAHGPPTESESLAAFQALNREITQARLDRSLRQYLLTNPQMPRPALWHALAILAVMVGLLVAGWRWWHRQSRPAAS